MKSSKGNKALNWQDLNKTFQQERTWALGDSLIASKPPKSPQTHSKKASNINRLSQLTNEPDRHLQNQHVTDCCEQFSLRIKKKNYSLAIRSLWQNRLLLDSHQSVVFLTKLCFVPLVFKWSFLSSQAHSQRDTCLYTQIQQRQTQATDEQGIQPLVKENRLQQTDPVEKLWVIQINKPPALALSGIEHSKEF